MHHLYTFSQFSCKSLAMKLAKAYFVTFLLHDRVDSLFVFMRSLKKAIIGQ